MVPLRVLKYGVPLLLAMMSNSLNANSLIGVTSVESNGKTVGLDFSFDEQATIPKYFVTNEGKQMVFDFPVTVKMKVPEGALDKLKSNLIESVSMMKGKQKSRMIIDLSQQETIRLLRQDEHTVQFALNIAYDSAMDTNGMTQKQMDNVIEEITFVKGIDRSGVLTIQLPKNHGLVTTKKDGDDVIIKIQKASIAEKWTHRMNVTSFETPLSSITGVNGFAYAEFRLRSNSLMSYEEVKDGNTLKVTVRKQSLNGNVFENNKKISLNLQDITVRAALQIIANFAGINMVVNDSVGGSITLGLKDVPWQQALEIILVSESLGKRQIGTILYIAPGSEIVAHEKAELSARQASEELAPLYTRFYPLNYSTAGEAMGLLQSASGGGFPILTPRGSIQADQRTNTLVIRDTEEGIGRAIEILKELDVPVEQVLIEARIVEINKEFLDEFGVKWVLKDLNISSGQDFVGKAYGSAHPGGFISSAGVAGTSTLGIAISRLFGNIDLSLEIRALESEGDAKLISSPHLTVSDNQEAFIKQGKEVPYLEASASGAASVTFKEAVLELKVTPQIAPNNTIILDIQVKKDQVSSSTIAGGGGVPSIDTREIQTRLMTFDGETIVLGGIYEKDLTKDQTKVPLLGDIPFLGWLFESVRNKIVNRELLIFITPTIIKTTIQQHES
jgi:type IV pilus assembly protein PilQ